MKSRILNLSVSCSTIIVASVCLVRAEEPGHSPLAVNRPWIANALDLSEAQSREVSHVLKPFQDEMAYRHRIWREITRDEQQIRGALTEIERQRERAVERIEGILRPGQLASLSDLPRTAFQPLLIARVEAFDSRTGFAEDDLLNPNRRYDEALHDRLTRLSKNVSEMVRLGTSNLSREETVRECDKFRLKELKASQPAPLQQPRVDDGKQPRFTVGDFVISYELFSKLHVSKLPDGLTAQRSGSRLILERDGKPLEQYIWHPEERMVTSFAFSHNGQFLVTTAGGFRVKGSCPGDVRIWEVATGKLLATINFDGWVKGAVFAGNELISVSVGSLYK